VFQQAAEHGIELGTERDELLSPPQLLTDRVQPERREDELTILHSCSGSLRILRV
jgi:hypothetical protein